MRQSEPIELERPTCDLVQRYVRQFENSERYFVGDHAIIKLFQWIPHNQNLDDILLKVSVVNDLYSTRIYGTFDMAKHIRDLDIDPELAKHSPDVVNRVADFQVGGKRRMMFSFATKYCNWHDQEQEHYPILDTFVEQLIVAYGKQDRFADFEKQDLRDYPRFKAILDAFRRHYGLMAFGLKKLDKFLWLYGQEKFPNKRLRQQAAAPAQPSR